MQEFIQLKIEKSIAPTPACQRHDRQALVLKFYPFA
jgi:hypothetical protein